MKKYGGDTRTHGGLRHWPVAGMDLTLSLGMYAHSATTLKMRRLSFASHSRRG